MILCQGDSKVAAFPIIGFMVFIIYSKLIPLIYDRSQAHLISIAFHSLLNISLAVGAYWMTVSLIPQIAELTEKAGLWGRDINKPKDDKVKVPEALGVVPAAIYLLVLTLLQLSVFQVTERSPFQSSLVMFNAALASICFMVLLGFADDVLDLRWRYKLILPTVGSVPLLVAYAGPTTLNVPIFLHGFLPVSFELGALMYVFLGMISVFATNAINIYAGINGLEAGQSLIIAICVALHNVVSIIDLPTGDFRDAQIFSLMIILPFIAVTCALLKYNWYPSRVFVGDTFTYFAGITLAVVAILGHQSKTVLLLFGPQILNFLLSIPQLFGIVHCPRHRVPTYVPETGLLKSSGNLTLINAWLVMFGNNREDRLCSSLLGLQAAWGIFVLICRDLLMNYVFEA